ncbi:MAG TPA: LysM peptidoglycan-binding domain-containing protein [Blastocatellia bacterium]|nr:LysM peptidoglycan-binding domain-containing protein [Blastocatellia bacterium]
MEKLTITPFSKQGQLLEARKITVLFNPNSYTITKNVKWNQPQSGTTGSNGKTENASAVRGLDAPPLTFGGGDCRQLSLELFFDITEPSNRQKDVREETDRIVKLTRIDRDLEQPPTVKIAWGGKVTADFPFIGVVSNLTQRFTLFKSTGEALRATLNLTFTEVLDPEKNKRETDPELTTRVVKRGDTLANIAAEVYRDATLWRLIAEANRLDDPRRLRIGQRLTIPELP